MSPARRAGCQELDLSYFRVWVFVQDSGENLASKSPEFRGPRRGVALHHQRSVSQFSDLGVFGGRLANEDRPFSNKTGLLEFKFPSEILRGAGKYLT